MSTLFQRVPYEIISEIGKQLSDISSLRALADALIADGIDDSGVYENAYNSVYKTELEAIKSRNLARGGSSVGWYTYERQKSPKLEDLSERDGFPEKGPKISKMVDGNVS